MSKKKPEKLLSRSVNTDGLWNGNMPSAPASLNLRKRKLLLRQ